MGKQITQPGAAIVHWSPNHNHIEFDVRVPLNNKKSSTAVGYMLVVNTILALVIIGLDFYNLVTFTNAYNERREAVVADPTATGYAKMTLLYDCLCYENLKYLSLALELLALASTWANHCILDMYKISHPFAFSALAV